jgi:hypothetical protein
MAAIYDYLLVVFWNWWSIVTGILFALDQLLECLFPRYCDRLNRRFPIEVRRKRFLWTLLFIIFLSGFLAWKDEHHKVDEKQAEINRQAGEIKEVSGAKKEVEQLRKEVAELRKKEQGRHLSKEEERDLIRSVSALGPHGVIINHENGDDKAHAFAEELVAMFNAIPTVPEWCVQRPNPITQLGPRKTGVFVIVTDQGGVPQAAAIVMASLKRQDIAFTLERRTPTLENYLGPRVFEIFVRSQPE